MLTAPRLSFSGEGQYRDFGCVLVHARLVGPDDAEALRDQRPLCAWRFRTSGLHPPAADADFGRVQGSWDAPCTYVLIRSVSH